MTGAARRPHGEREPVLEKIAIGQARELVVEHRALRGLGDLQEARVLQEVNEMGDSPLVVAQGVCRFERQELVAASRYELCFLPPRLAGQKSAPHPLILRGAAGDPQVGEIDALQLAERGPKHAAQMRVDVLDGTRRQRHRHPDRDLLDDSGKVESLPGHGCTPAELIPEPAAYATSGCYYQFVKTATKSNRSPSCLVIVSTA